MTEPWHNCIDGYELWHLWFCAFIDGNRISDDARQTWLAHVKACEECTYQGVDNVLDTPDDTGSD